MLRSLLWLPEEPGDGYVREEKSAVCATVLAMEEKTYRKFVAPVTIQNLPPWSQNLIAAKEKSLNEGKRAAALTRPPRTVMTIFAPVAVPEDKNGRYWYSVQVTLPDDIEADVRRCLDARNDASKTTLIHEALYDYRATVRPNERLTADLKAALFEGLRDPGDAIEATPQFWDALKRRARAHGKLTKQMQEQGTLGNLLLPKELYEFVQSQIHAGNSKDATQLVCNAWRSRAPSDSGRQPGCARTGGASHWQAPATVAQRVTGLMSAEGPKSKHRRA